MVPRWRASRAAAPLKPLGLSVNGSPVTEMLVPDVKLSADKNEIDCKAVTSPKGYFSHIVLALKKTSSAS